MNRALVFGDRHCADEATSSCAWNRFLLPPAYPGVAREARFSLPIQTCCHLHARVFLALLRGLQACKTYKDRAGFLEDKVGSKQGTRFTPSTTVTKLGIVRPNCVGVRNE